jgi:pimeloyl-ACP methyl ester carboxylesterase
VLPELERHHDVLAPTLLGHQMLGVVSCEVFQLIEYAAREGYSLDAEKITCPVRIVWGTDDKLLAWPSTAARYRNDWEERSG